MNEEIAGTTRNKRLCGMLWFIKVHGLVACDGFSKFLGNKAHNY